MTMTLEQAKSAILNSFIANRLPEVRTTLHSLKADDAESFRVGPTTKQIADFLDTSPPRVMRHLQPLMDGRSGDLVGGVDEGGYRWWYRGMHHDLIAARPDLGPILKASGLI